MPTPTQQCLGPGVVSDSIAILGIHAHMTPSEASVFNPWIRREEVALFFDYLAQGRMKVSDLITHRYPWREVPAAYQMLAADRSQAMAVVLEGWEG